MSSRGGIGHAGPVTNTELGGRDARLGGFVERPTLDQYGTRYAEHLVIRRGGGIVEVRTHTDGGSAVFSRGMLNAWGEALHDLGGDRDNEVLIITGTGDRWVGGVDRSFAEPLSRWSKEELYEQYVDGVKLLERMAFEIEIPTIAAINGPGPRMELALMCDLVLCAEAVVFADGNFGAGSVPGDGMHLVLEELIGPRRATHMTYTSTGLDARSALELGVVSEVLAAEQLLPRAREIAATIMGKPRTSRRLAHGLVGRRWQRRVVTELRGAYAQQLLASS
jgi:enoyl-CoA hydratase/carnithine racemase